MESARRRKDGVSGLSGCCCSLRYQDILILLWTEVESWNWMETSSENCMLLCLVGLQLYLLWKRRHFQKQNLEVKHVLPDASHQQGYRCRHAAVPYTPELSLVPQMMLCLLGNSAPGLCPSSTAHNPSLVRGRGSEGEPGNQWKKVRKSEERRKWMGTKQVT